MATLTERFTSLNQAMIGINDALDKTSASYVHLQQQMTAFDQSVAFIDKETAAVKANSAVKQTQIETSVALAKAKGDEAQSIALAADQTNHTLAQSQQEINLTNQRIAITDTMIAKLQDEALATGEISPEQQKYIQGLIDENEARKNTVAGLQAKVPLLQYEAQQAAIAAGPIGELTRALAAQAAEHIRVSDAINIEHQAQLTKLEGDYKIAQIQGDTIKIDKLQIAINDQKILQAKDMVAFQQTTLKDLQAAYDAKVKEFQATGDLTSAEKDQLAQMNDVILGRKNLVAQSIQTEQQLIKEKEATESLKSAATDAVPVLARLTSAAIAAGKAVTNASIAVKEGAAGYAGGSGGYGSTAADGAAFVAAQARANALPEPKPLGLQELVDKLGKEAWDSQRQSYQAAIDVNRQFIANNQAQIATLQAQKDKLEQTGVDAQGNAVPIPGNAALANQVQLQINQHLASLQQYEQMATTAEKNIKTLDDLIAAKNAKILSDNLAAADKSAVSQPSSAPPSAKTYTLNLNIAGKSLQATTTSDPAAFLAALEQAQRSAA